MRIIEGRLLLGSSGIWLAPPFMKILENGLHHAAPTDSTEM
jgi:hypothetical protein